jgi:uncharacterized membrane protein
MRTRGFFRLLIALLVLGAFAAVASGAYSAGYIAGAGSTASNPWVYGGFYGLSGIFGLIVTIFILVIIVRILSMLFWGRHHSWAGSGAGDQAGPGAPGAAGQGGPGPWYPGWHHGWYGGRRQAMFDEWHRRAHEAQTNQQPGGPSTGGPSTGGPAAGPTTA